MRKFISILLVVLLAVPAFSQKRRRATPKAPVKPATERAQEALSQYDFGKAEDILNEEKAALTKKRKDASHLEPLLQAARTGRNKLHATERIVIIDSLVCDKVEMLKAIRLSNESGRINPYAAVYHTQDTLGATLFENELGNKRYLAFGSPEGPLRLAVSDKIGEDWSTPTLLKGLSNEEQSNDSLYSENYPFLLSDGITLFYAANGSESMGGYDIFVSRSDGEDGSFLMPENMGFPYNSTANDYLLAVDELNQLGWFVSDRNQPEGKVCIYTFIPNEIRQVYGDEVSESTIRKLARVTSIRDTWPAEEDMGIVTDAKKRLTALRSGKGNGGTQAAPAFIFPIDDQRTYHQLTDFRSPVARQKIVAWQKLSKNVTIDTTVLQRQRDNYANASQADRQQMAASILRLEKNLDEQQQELQQLAKEIRNAEISYK